MENIVPDIGKENDYNQFSHDYAFTFSIIISTYNRGYILYRALESISKQTFRDFEVVVVDDGSTDDTNTLIAKWADSVDFPVHYFWQPNQGRHVAYNAAFKIVKGYFSIILDSDDKLSQNALEILLSHWNLIPDSEKSLFAGVEGLCADMNTGEISGGLFPQNIFDSNYLESRKIYGVTGEKKRAVRTDVHHLFPFPVFSNEKYLRPALLWNRIARCYKFRYVNQIIQFIEYQPDGLNKKRFVLRTKNPNGFRLYFQEELTMHGDWNNLKDVLSFYSRYIRYSLHSRITLNQQRRDIPSKFFWTLCFLPGYIGWLRDKIRLKWYKT